MPKAKSIAALINQSLELSEQIAALTAENEAVRKQILADLKANGNEAAETPLASAQIRRSQVAQIDDEAEFYLWTQEPGNGDVLKIGVVHNAWRARLTAGVKVPGVASFTRETLYIVKQHKLADA